MTDTVARRLDELLERVEGLPDEERAAVLAELCRGDPGLRATVEQLLALERRMPAEFLQGAGEEPARLEPAPGTWIGGYEVLERIGEGGMGTVYAARQASPRREVALKLLRSACLPLASTGRFFREVEVLGNLDHPGIARIHEAGTAVLQDLDGGSRNVPFFAMELVRGADLLEHARRRGLTRDQRIELLARTCDAVHHAHQRGVIHRDLKPDNVLVVDDGEIGRPKVLDFGIARLEREQTTLQTRDGDILGTLATMSPEQVGGDRKRVDVRSDVYALGSILYLLLTGTPPIDVAGASLPEAIVRIRDEDPRPLHEHDPALRGDLSIIGTKALQKDRERRYQSAAELAADLRRYVAGEAIAARSDSALYVLRKRLRRHRVLAIGGALTLALTTIYGLLASHQASVNRGLAARESRARAHAERALAASNIERGRLLGRTGKAEAEQLLWEELLRAPESDHARWALWEFYAEYPYLATRQAHRDKVLDARFSPSGRYLATAAADGRALLLEPGSLEERARLEGLPAGATAVCFAPGERSLVVGCQDGLILVLDLETLAVERELRGHRGMVRSLEFQHGGGGALLSASYDGDARLWDHEAGACTAVLDGHSRRVWTATFSPDGRTVATAGDGRVLLWEAPFEQPARALEGHRGEVVAVAFAPAGDRLWSGGSDQRLLTWDLASGEHEAVDLESGTIRRIWNAPDGETFLVASWWSIERRRIDSGLLQASVPLSNFSWGVDTSPDGERLVIGDSRGVVRVQSLSGESAVRAIEGGAGRTPAEFSPDGRMLATGTPDGVVRLLDVATRALLGEFQAHDHPLLTLDHHPTLDRLLSVDTQGHAVLWDLETATPVWELDDFKATTTRNVAYHPGGELVAAARKGGRATVLRVADGSEVFSPPLSRSETLSVSWSPDGALLAISKRRDQEVQVWSLEERERRAVLHLQGENPWTTCFSPDGRYLLAGTWESAVQVWDLDSSTLAGYLRGHETIVSDLTFLAAREDVLASCSLDGTVRLWTLEGWRNLLTLPLTEEGFLKGVRSGPRGELLATSSLGAGAALIDLGHNDRHIAARARLHVDRARGDAPASEAQRRLLAWSEQVLALPWPRLR